ncbi:MAG: hypothetical protein FWG37_02485 [Clostridia bacterium]|nr:hypothetical protein [Clostridia bacterium]
MKRILVVLLCAALLPLLGLAEDAPRVRSADLEKALRTEGFEMRSEWTFHWGGFPMLSQEENQVLESLLSAIKVVTRVHEQGENGYRALDLYLQNVSVLDLAMRAASGDYMETSNLLGGRTVSFTREEFSAFIKRFSERSDGALLSNMDIAFDLMMLALGGNRETTVDMRTLGLFSNAVEDWRLRALIPREVLRPRVTLPGIYGARAVVGDVTRAEAVDLARQIEFILAGADELWRDAVAARYPDETEESQRSRMIAVTELIRSFADTVENALPASMKPIEFREIYGLEGDVVSRQLEIEIPGELLVFVEWDINEDGLAALYGSIRNVDSGLSILYTREDGQPAMTGNVMRQRKRALTEINLFVEDFSADLIVTRHENLELRADKEIVACKTEYMLRSDPLLGEDTTVSLMLLDITTASGEDAKYNRTFDRSVYLRGLGFDNRQLIKISGQISPAEPHFPPGLGEDADVLYPASFSDETLDRWIEDAQVSLLQGWYTVLGRLPPIVAMYVLENWM